MLENSRVFLKPSLFFTPPEGSTATVLQKVAVDYISNAWCSQLYNDRFDITDNMVCTYTPKKDACQVRTALLLGALQLTLKS